MLDKILIEKDINKFLKDLFDLALEEKASDIHIEAFEAYAKIRFRVDGVLLEKMRLEKDLYQKLITKIKLMSKMDISEKRRPQDSRLSLKEYENVDFRISSLNTVNGEKLVIRVLSFKEFKNNSNLLGFSQKSKDIISEIIQKKSGMIIFSGPTGSGKSTSLYSLLNDLNSETVNIITVEDPVEYAIEGINQVEVNEKIGLTFSSALRSILRQDPDIIMVGEVRDYETAKMSIRSSITGHLVITTLHTNDSKSAIIRLKDLGIEDYLLSSAINAVVSQRLVRKLCTCKKEDEMTDFEYKIASKYREVDKNKKVYRPCGCSKCNNGYIGREAIEEVLLLDSNLKKSIRKNDNDFKDLLSNNNFTTMFENGLKKVFDGKTSFEELLSVLYKYND